MNDATAYLLGELSRHDAAAFERAMAADPGLRDEVERLRPVVTRLHRLPPAAWEPPQPPPLALPEPEPAPRRRRLVLRPAVAAACALVLVAAGVGIGALVGGGDEEPAGGERIALAPLDAPRSATGRVTVADGVELDVSGLPPSRAGDFYELWLLGADKQLVSLGSFAVGADGRARLDVPLPVDPSRFAYFDVSREPGDGDPGHSGLSVLRGGTSQ